MDRVSIIVDRQKSREYVCFSSSRTALQYLLNGDTLRINNDSNDNKQVCLNDGWIIERMDFSPTSNEYFLIIYKNKQSST